MKATYLALIAAATAFSLSAFADVPKSEAKIPESQAKATAMRQVARGSTIKSSELEREHGKLIWSFDISQPSTSGVTEVNVDAKTGKIVSKQRESASAERQEARKERSSSGGGSTSAPQRP